MSLPSEPITRKEQYLAKAAGQAVEIPDEPITREEAYLNAIANKPSSVGTSDYNQLENLPQVNGNTIVGNKSASDLGLADNDTVQGILDGQSINSFSDVETALTGKQDALTAGDYIDITNNEISVNRNIIPDNTTYNIKHVSRYNAVVIKYINGVKQSENNYQYWGGTVWTIDDAFNLVCDRDNSSFAYQLLADTIDHTAGYYGILFDLNETSVGVEVDLVFPEEDTSGQKLIIKSEMDAALALKQNALTAGDDIKINNDEISVEVKIPLLDDYEFSLNSDNYIVITKKLHDGTTSSQTIPSGVYTTYTIDNLFTLQYNAGWTVVLLVASTDYPVGQSWTWGYGQTPAIQKLSFATSYNTGSASEFIKDLQDEVAGKQNATDNNLQTTTKEIVPAINEINSNLSSMSLNMANAKTVQILPGDNIVDVSNILLGIVAFTTYADFSLYFFYKESSTSIFCHQITKSAGGATVSYSVANKINIANPTAFGGFATIFYKNI